MKGCLIILKLLLICANNSFFFVLDHAIIYSYDNPSVPWNPEK